MCTTVSSRSGVNNFNQIDTDISIERNQTKLDPKYKGPFKVVEVFDGNRYVLKALNSRRTYKYVHDRLRSMSEDQVPLEVEEFELSDSGES